VFLVAGLLGLAGAVVAAMTLRRPAPAWGGPAAAAAGGADEVAGARSAGGASGETPLPAAEPAGGGR
jgi:hypothetical protein